jgi:hypothetical protein
MTGGREHHRSCDDGHSGEQAAMTAATTIVRGALTRRLFILRTAMALTSNSAKTMPRRLTAVPNTTGSHSSFTEFAAAEAAT